MQDLEEKLAHLERLVDDLSVIVARQDQTIERMEAQLALLRTREAAREAEGQGGIVFGDERPPHY